MAEIFRDDRLGQKPTFQFSECCCIWPPGGAAAFVYVFSFWPFWRSPDCLFWVFIGPADSLAQDSSYMWNPEGCSSFFSFYEAKRKQTLAHLPSSSIAGTIFIPQPSYEVKKSSGHLELSVDTLTTTLGPLVWMLGAKTFKNGRKFTRVLCLDLHDSNMSDQICIKLFVTLQI